MQLRLVSKTHIAPSLNRLAITLASATLISAGVFTASSASAQSGNIPASQVSSLNAQGAYDDQTLRSFATVATTVLALRSTYYPRIQAAKIAGAEEKADLLFEEMRQHMHSVVENSVFSTDQYRAISNAAKTDAALRQRINTIIQGPSPAQQHVQQVTRIQPQAPQVASAPSNPAPVTPATAPTVTPAPVAPVAVSKPVDDGARQRLEAELRKTNAERDRYQIEQAALQAKVQKLESQLSSVKAQDSALRQQLSAKKAQTEAAQKKSQAELDALQGEVTTLKEELTTVQSRDASLRELLEAETLRAEAEKNSKEAKLAVFRGEIKRLADRLATAQQALDALAGDLAPGTAMRAPAFEPLQPLRRKPNSIEKVLAKTQPAYAKTQELDNEIARIQNERRRREAERQALQSEITELSRDLAATYQAMAELIGEPTNVTVAAAEPDIRNDAYPLDLSQETALLFEGIPAQFDQARADPQADILLTDPLPVGSGHSGIEPRPGQPADSAALEPAAVAPLRVNRAPDIQIATASAPTEPAEADAVATPEAPVVVTQTPHQVVRDEAEFKPIAEEPQTAAVTPPAMPSQDYANSISGGAAAYKAADYRRAFEIWAPLANSGSRSAQFHLGALYLEGRGTNIDFPTAYFWLRLAARRGDERAVPLLAIVAGRLTQEEIRASEDQTQEWLDKRAVKVTQSKPAAKDRL